MKFLIALACLLVVAYANEQADVIERKQEVNVEDFNYNLELTNGIKASQSGRLEKEHSWLVKGEYEYVSKDGKHVRVTYVADESGYHPKVEV